MSDKLVPVPIRVPRSLHRRIKAIAKEQGVSMNRLLNDHFKREANRFEALSIPDTDRNQ